MTVIWQYEYKRLSVSLWHWHHKQWNWSLVNFGFIANFGNYQFACYIRQPHELEPFNSQHV